MSKNKKDSRRHIEYRFRTELPAEAGVTVRASNKRWIGCNEPKAGDLLAVDMVYKEKLDSVLWPHGLKIGPLVKPFANSKVNGWYKLEVINEA